MSFLTGAEAAPADVASAVRSDQTLAERASPPAAPTSGQKLINALETLQGFTNGATVKVIVHLNPPRALSAATDFRSPTFLRTLHSETRQAQQEVLDTMVASEVRPRCRFNNMTSFSAEVTLQGLAALQAHARVNAIEPVRTLEAHLAQGIPLIHGMTFRSIYNGSGTAIAICDAGVDYTHSMLGGGAFPNTKVIGGYNFGDNNANPAPNGQAHGTACAGIAAGDLGTVGDYIGGVAYNAKIYALKITQGSDGGAYSDALAAAWDWCITHRNDNPSAPIVAISTSFGGDRFFANCDGGNLTLATAANNATAAGIAVLASSGNDGYCDSIASPACLSSVISVGAVYDAAFGTYLPCVSSACCAPKTPGGCASGYYCTDVTAPDKVASYANTASFLSLLAPANQCYTLDIVGPAGYTTGDYYPSFGGTSAACPYAAGAVACLQSAAKALTGAFLTPAQVKNLLATYGDVVTDTKAAITKPRVNLERAIQSLQSWTLMINSANPTGGVSISASPADKNNKGVGATPLSLSYAGLTVVIVTAPSLAGGSHFWKWRLDGADVAATPATTVTMTASHTLTAIYDPLISGVILDTNSLPLAGVNLDFSNGGGTATTGANGAYSHEVPYGWSGAVTPSMSCYSFNPTLQAYNNLLASTAQGFTATPAICTLSPAGANFAAGGGSGAFTVTVSAPCPWAATSSDTWVHTTSTGTASGTVNYTVDANAGTSGRSGSIKVAGQVFAISQDGEPMDPNLVADGPLLNPCNAGALGALLLGIGARFLRHQREG